MALKAGYYGIKDYLVKKLKRLPPIKSIGSGLQLTSAGVLKATGGSGGGSNIRVKTVTYTGIGTTSASSFSLETGDGAKLLFVLAIDAENGTESYHVNTCSPGSWDYDRYNISIATSYSTVTMESGAISVNGDLIQLNGGSVKGACNVEGVTYRMKYVIDDSITPSTEKKKSK